MKAPAVTPAYVTAIYARVCEIGRYRGYAMALHGTLGRDIDVVAIPWTHDACDPLELAMAVKDELGGYFHHPDYDHFFKDGAATKKPHGRLAYSIHFSPEGGAGPYLDLSVMPRLGPLS